jgi:hypothetical protein
MKITKITKGIYYDNVSHRCIEKSNGIWNVKNECTGEVYFYSKTLKECKEFQSAENEILLWNN